MECKDVLTCGHCGYSTDCVISWLQHKTEHVSKGPGRGCELCNSAFSRQAALHEHYRRKHQVDYDLVLKKCRTLKRVKNGHRTKKYSITKILQTSAELTQNTSVVLASPLLLNETLVKSNELNGESFYDSQEVCLPNNYSSSRNDSIPFPVFSSENINIQSATAADLLTSDVKISPSLHTGNLDKSGDASVGSAGVINLMPKVIIVTVRKEQETGKTSDHIEQVTDGTGVDSIVNTDVEKTVFTGVDICANSAKTVLSADNEILQAVTHPVASEKHLAPKDVSEINNEMVSDDEEELHDNTEKENENENTDVSVGNIQVPKYKVFGRTRKLTPDKGTIAIELNMPDFYFAHCILNIGRNQGRISRDEFICVHCIMKFKSRMLMCRHMRENHEEILASEKALTKPSVNKNHGGQVMKMTEFIKMELSVRPPKRVRGVETQDMPGKFPCQICGKVFGRLRYLRGHYKHHEAQSVFLCPVCSKTFKTNGNLEQHLKTHEEREPYKCPECDFVSKVNIAIHKHRQIHNSCSQICDVCGRGYKDKSTLTKHKRVHDPTRPFACSYTGCTWRFRTEMASNAHIRLHTAKREYICEMCGYAFRQKHHLQRHEQSVHNKITSTEKKTFADFNATKDHSLNEDSFEDIDNEKAIESVSEVTTEVNLAGNEENLSGVISSDQFDLENAIQSGQLVITTTDGSYEMFDIGSNIVYQTVIPDGQSYGTNYEAQPMDNVQLYEQEETVQTEVTIEQS